MMIVVHMTMTHDITGLQPVPCTLRHCGELRPAEFVNEVFGSVGVKAKSNLANGESFETKARQTWTLF
jgi:hypothetical protein